MTHHAEITVRCTAALLEAAQAAAEARGESLEEFIIAAIKSRLKVKYVLDGETIPSMQSYAHGVKAGE